MRVGQPKLSERKSQRSWLLVTSLHQGPHRAIDDYGLEVSITAEHQQYEVLLVTAGCFSILKKLQKNSIDFL
jgi:hypothetical protein